METVISEKESNARYIAYIYASLRPIIDACGGKTFFSFESDRVALVVESENKYESYLRRLAEEKIAEVVCVGYKYEAFRKALMPAGIGKEDREILLAALISADFADDRRYVFSRLKGSTQYTVDGFFAFRLAPLRKKWESVIECVPTYFTQEKLAAFMSYLLREDAGEKVFVRGEEVFDKHYHKLRRASLIEEGVSGMNGVREIILSGAGEVECVSAPPPVQENFLKRYYAGRVSFY